MIASSIIGGFAVVVLVYLFNYFRVQLRRHRDINKLPGPPALQLLRETVSTKHPFEKYKFVQGLTKQYGPVVKLWIKPFKPAIMVSDLEFVDKILNSKDHLEKTKMYELLKPYIGEGIATTTKFDLWKKNRKICNTAFQHGTVTGLLPIFTKYTNTFLEFLRSKAGTPLETQSVMHLYALDMVFEALTKTEHNFQENNNPAYLNARIEFFEILAKRIYSVYLANDLIFKFSGYFPTMNRAMGVIRDFTYNIIRSKERENENGNLENSKLHLIDVLYANNVHGESLNDELNTFILAAHDTVAQTMCYSLYKLSKYKEVQQKLYHEIKSVVGEDGEITNIDLQNMKYLEAVIKEVTRLHTVVPIIERKTSYDLSIQGVNYPAGTMFMFNLQAIHLSEKYFKNPDKFDPNRFMPENAQLIQKNSFITFSAGPRDCIGKLFGMLVLKFFIAKAVQKFEILPVENHELEIVNEIIIKSLTGIPVILKERSRA